MKLGWLEPTPASTDDDEAPERSGNASSVAGALRVAIPFGLALIVLGLAVFRRRATLLALLGVAPHSGLDGIDLQVLWKAPNGPPGARWLFAAGGPGRTVDSIRSVRDGRHKLVLYKLSGRRELYDLIADPREKENLVGMRPEVESRLWQELSRVVRSESVAPDAPAIPGTVRQRLEQLGYE